MSFYNFFFVANRICSKTSHKLPNQSPPQKLFQVARDLFILMDSAIICIHLSYSQPPISLKITAASLIRKTLAIISTNLLKQGLTFSSNTFYVSFNPDFSTAKISRVVIISSSGSANSSSFSRSGGGSSSGSDSTSGCGSSSSKILTCTGEYKLGGIAGSGLVNTI